MAEIVSTPFPVVIIGIVVAVLAALMFDNRHGL
jgi:hypothetical protein